jgi:hypothetical protein
MDRRTGVRLSVGRRSQLFWVFLVFRKTQHWIISTMGDCRMRVSISKQLVGEEGESSEHVFARTYAADTTIREVAEDVKPLWSLISSKVEIGLWDCTYHPPKDITDWPTKEYPDYLGLKSKTLHDAGCFPSGTWLVLPKGVHPSQASKTDYDDYQYNNQQSRQQSKVQAPKNAPPVTFTDSTLASSKPLPSQLMESVAKRFETEEANELSDEQAILLRRQNQERQRQTEQERAQKLEGRITKLNEESSEKNKSVSDQVRKMLVKSRATGNPSLKIQDRIFFHCLLDDGTDVKMDYRYFSPQDTFAKIPSTFPSRGNNSEVLVRRSSDDQGHVYKRLPVTMRVYEAMAQSFLTDQVDTLVIRWFQDGDEPTPSILEGKEAATCANDVHMIDAEVALSDEKIDASAFQVVDQPMEGVAQVEDNELTEAIRIMDEENSKGKKPKKKSAASDKVRNMHIKSKAKGDAKRVSKMENRFFLEVVLVQGGTATSSYQFLAKTDSIERLLQNISSSTASSDYDFVVPSSESDNSYNRIEETTMKLEDAEANNVLKCFDRIILRQLK